MLRNRKPHREAVGPGQESVWDYPRPPELQPTTEHVRVVHRGVVLADSHRCWRILETSHAPAYYIPATDVATEFLRTSDLSTVCEFKGRATYADVVVPDGVVQNAAWWYANPTSGYEAMEGAISFYPQRVDLCEVDGEAVTPLASTFYGDWPTSRIAGPYKGGAPGSEWW